MQFLELRSPAPEPMGVCPGAEGKFACCYRIPLGWIEIR
jgi:hypothetical protein